MKKIALILLSFLLMILFLAALTPAIASTAWGKKLVLKTASKMAGGSVEIDTLELSWFGKQRIQNLQVEKEDGSFNLKCLELTSQASLWQILVQHNLREVKLVSPQMELTQASFYTPAPAFKKRLGGFVPEMAAKLPALSSYRGIFNIENGSLVMGSLQITELQLDLNLSVDMPISIIASGKTLESHQPGTFSIHGLLSDPTVTLQVEMSHFPVGTIDELVSLSNPAMKGMITELVGKSMNVSVDFQSTPSTMEATVSASSSQFSMSAKTEIAGDAVILSKPASINFQVSPLILQKLFKLDAIAPATASLQVTDFSLPIATKEAFRFSAVLSASAVGDIEPFSISIATENFSEKVFEIGLNSPQFQLSSLKLRLLNGAELLEPVTFSGIASGEISKLQVPEEWKKLQLVASATLYQEKLAITVDTLKSIVGTVTLAQLPSPLPPLLTEPAAIPFTITDIDLDTFQAQGSIQLAKLPLAEYPISAISADFRLDGKQKRLESTFSGRIATGGLDLNISVQNEIYDLKGAIEKVPTRFFELWLGQNTKLQPIFGQQISAKLQLHSDPVEQNLFLKTDSDLLGCEISLKQKDGMIQLEKSGKINYTLTKEGYASLDYLVNQTPSPFALTKPALIKMSLSKLSIPATLTENRIPELNFSPNQFMIEGSAAIDDLAFTDTLSLQETKISNLTLSLGKTEPRGELAFKLTGAFAGKGSLQATGSYIHDSQSISFETEINQFPSKVVDLLLRALGKGDLIVTTVVGPLINATAKAQILDHTGPLQLNINTPNARISVDGQLTKGNLTLNDTIYAQLKMTPELSKLLLQDVNPLSVSAMRADAPMTLEIPAAGFSVFMYPFIPSQMNVPQARIELGQIYCQNEGNLNIAISLLKLSQFARDKELPVWFAPIDLHINNGVIDCERTEILVASAYQICTWGKVDLVKDDVQMVLGLTASCLKKAFGIKNLPEKYVLQIPMTGPTNNVSINTTNATAKIAALLLWQQKAVAGGFMGGPAGAIVGEFLNKLGPLPDAKSSTPPPKHPFPWESQNEPPPEKKNTSNTSSRKHKKHIRGTEKPLKQILKLIK